MDPWEGGHQSGTLPFWPHGLPSHALRYGAESQYVSSPLPGTTG